MVAGMIQIFSTCKPWRDIDAVMQRNAITSWTLLPGVDILLIGDDEGTAEFAEELGLRHIPEVETTEQGTPLIPSLWDIAMRNTKSDLLAYVNADIILLDDFAIAVEAIASQMENQFLAIGQRYNTHLRKPIDFATDWQAMVRAFAGSGSLYAECAVDYFVWRGNFWGKLPPMAVGRYTWDNVLVGAAALHRIDIVDTTGSITAVHQLHGKLPWDHPEALVNRKVTQGVSQHGIKSARWKLVDGIVTKI